MIEFFIGILLLMYCKFRHKEAMRMDWDILGKFITGMIVISFGRIAFSSFLLQIGLNPIAPVTGISFFDLSLVFWEDAFFVLPIYLTRNLKDHPKLKYLWYFIILFFSTFFMLGHTSYPLYWTIITFFYPFFISYKYGMKYGFGTIMMCHILYDMFTVLVAKLMPYILL